MTTFTKEQLIAKLQHRLAVATKYPDLEEAQFDAAIFKIALASLEAEPVGWRWSYGGKTNWRLQDSTPGAGNNQNLNRVIQPLYTATPAPVVPDIQHSERFDWTFGQWAEHLGGRHQNNDPGCYYEFGSFMAVAEMMRQFGNVQRKVGWNACRAAMLQSEPVNQPSSNHPSADAVVGCEIKQPSTNEHVTQIKQVADLYEVNVPGGRSTTFTTDAAEAKDCAVMGWKVQEYVKLERYQSAMLQGKADATLMHEGENHPEDKLDMVDHSGDGNEKVDCRLPFDQWLSQKNEPIGVDCGCVTTEAFYHWLRVAYEAGNYPVVPDWQAQAEKMAELHGSSFVVFHNGESPQCADPSKVIISFTDEGLGHGSAAPQQEV